VGINYQSGCQCVGLPQLYNFLGHHISAPIKHNSSVGFAVHAMTVNT